MKTLLKKQIYAFAVIVMIISACSNKNDDSATPDSTTETLSQGDWKVSSYIDSGSDETHKFQGYTFKFADNGVLTATNGSSSVSGSWSTGSDDSQVKLYLNFSNPSSFEELTDDWHVLEQTSALIRLEDVSGGNGGTDYLTFSSN